MHTCYTAQDCHLPCGLSQGTVGFGWIPGVKDYEIALVCIVL